MDLISQLKQHGLIKHGSFILKSGEKSEIYFNLKGAISYPNLMDDIAFQLAKLIKYDPKQPSVESPLEPFHFPHWSLKLQKCP